MASLGQNELSPANIFIPEEWSEAAAAVAYDSSTSPAPAPVTLVCGPKNSGKTTFSRLLLNVLLQRYKKVAYLDTDVGQTEFTPPGFLSLIVIDKIIPDLSIPCLKTPERCFFFGDVSSKRDPKTYLAYIFALYDHYRRTYVLSSSEIPGNAVLPLVINTTGWVKGIGYDILVDILRYISPTHVVKICISAKSKNLPAGAFWLNDGEAAMETLIEVNSARQDSLNRSFPRVSEVFYSLNASIVGLAVCSECSENTPDCIGLGIVRAIDTFKQVVYVITPVPQDSLEKVDLLLQGFIQIPTCLLQVQGCISPYMSSNVMPAIT